MHYNLPMRLIFIITLLLFSANGLSQDKKFDERWYFNVNAGAVVPDDSLQLNDAKIFDFRVGKAMSEVWSYEIVGFADEYDFDIDYGLKHTGVGINFLDINQDPLWKPYFLMGVGLIRHETQDESGTNLYFNVGIGGSWYFFGDNVRLRAEAVSRLDLNDTKLPGQDGFGDGVFTVGLTIPLGN
ncbi:MAG TPA: hypothetical protein PK055_11410 [Gammaproteobacteria bacterium]|jgi:hypothetical protein|nr:hypothetical protein [Xanthomonadales bacterium]MCB1603753.1 hypothetical protein [Xanthomonadales bacterium]HOP23110.1 hypothetical protein [Gammaproteobacteria bacterium]HPI96749.1 hypothetical protein [Gammaproteobacteria bacterium]HPQ88257.1 hypothetical protein [Gammaproteobacteria bacterium]